MENKRKEERVVPSDLEPIEVQIMGDGFIDILTAKDIGPGGVGIYVAHGFQGLNIVCDVEIIISIPREKSFKARGVIKHNRQLSNHHSEQQDFFGILFTQICKRHRQLLERYVEERVGEKRQDVRVTPESDRPTEVKIVRESGEITATLRDISTGGVGILGTSVFNGSGPGDTLDFTLALPQEDQFLVKGTLRYADKEKNCVGICFNGLTDWQHRAIKEYVVARLNETQPDGGPSPASE